MASQLQVFIHPDRSDITSQVAPGARQPACRAWADVLLRLASEEEAASSRTLAARRATAAIGALVAPSDEWRLLSVAADRCVLGARSAAPTLFTARGWSDGLMSHLVDIGFPADLVHEHVLPAAAPLTPMRVEAASAAVLSCRPDLLAATQAYFAHECIEYVRSLTEPSAAGQRSPSEWEVLLPADGAGS